KVYGHSSEQLDPNQSLLFDISSDETTTAALPPAREPEPAPASAANSPVKPGHGRRRAPDTLLRVPLIHDLTSAEKEALGGAANLIELADEITEQWDYKT